jgi:hypothetical protein
VINEIGKYVEQLNKAKLGLDLQPRKEALDEEDVRKQFKFITYNDTRNMQKNLAQQFDTIAGYT